MGFFRRHDLHLIQIIDRHFLPFGFIDDLCHPQFPVHIGVFIIDIEVLAQIPGKGSEQDRADQGKRAEKQQPQGTHHSQGSSHDLQNLFQGIVRSFYNNFKTASIHYSSPPYHIPDRHARPFVLFIMSETKQNASAGAPAFRQTSVRPRPPGTGQIWVRTKIS